MQQGWGVRGLRFGSEGPQQGQGGQKGVLWSVVRGTSWAGGSRELWVWSEGEQQGWEAMDQE